MVPQGVAMLPQGVVIASAVARRRADRVPLQGISPSRRISSNLDTRAVPVRYVQSSPRRWPIGRRSPAGTGEDRARHRRIRWRRRRDRRLAGGKEGRFVGAAVGGGAASLFEALRH
jgi:hypothetical protein